MRPTRVDEENTKGSNRLLQRDKQPSGSPFRHTGAPCLRRGKIGLGIGLDGYAARRVYRWCKHLSRMIHRSRATPANRGKALRENRKGCSRTPAGS